MTTTVADPAAALPAALIAVGAGQRLMADTNVLIYSSSATAPLHAAARASLNYLLQAGVEVWISRQILREFAAGMSRPQPFAAPVPMPVVLADIARFVAAFRIAEDGPNVFNELISLIAHTPCGGRQVYDANIVATMLARGIPALPTHNVADFRRFAGQVTVVPLA